MSCTFFKEKAILWHNFITKIYSTYTLSFSVIATKGVAEESQEYQIVSMFTGIVIRKWIESVVLIDENPGQNINLNER